MIIVNILHNAGIGNQLFMFSMGYAFSRKKNQSLLLVVKNTPNGSRPVIYDYLQMKCEEAPRIRWVRVDRIKNRIVFNQCKRIVHIAISRFPFSNRLIGNELDSNRMYHEYNIKKGNVYIDGFWESYKYFDEYATELQEVFSIKYIPSESVQNLLNRINNSTSVAVHIRRGDFVKLGRAIDIEYYVSAMNQMRGMLVNPRFFVVSTDKDVKSFFGKYNDVECVEFESKQKDIDEWNVLKSCRHHIISNSTYSWWAAYLANDENKIVLKPSLELYTKVEGNESTKFYDDFYKSEWIDVKY